MMRIGILAASLLALTISDLGASDFWQDTFIPEESDMLCADNDAIAAYGEKEAKFWEQDCSIEKQTKITGVDGIILNLSCFGEGEDLGRSRSVLLNVGDGRVVRFPPFQVLKRCSAATAAAATSPTPLHPGDDQCPYNSRLYRSPLLADKRTDSYQELQFISGDDSGSVEIKEVRGGQVAWTAQGEHGCSNGASICRISFPVMSGDPISEPYEAVVSPGEKSPNLIVVPALKQQVYYSELNATSSGKPYGGLKANLMAGFFPKADELLLPENVFRFAGCKVP